MNRLEQKWVVDAFADNNGDWTIRIDNGTKRGDMDQSAVATVFGRALADEIVRRHNDSLGSVIIYSASEQGYWSNVDGWVEDREDATVFTKSEANTFNLPQSSENDAQWVEA